MTRVRGNIVKIANAKHVLTNNLRILVGIGLPI